MTFCILIMSLLRMNVEAAYESTKKIILKYPSNFKFFYASNPDNHEPLGASRCVILT